MSTVPVSDQLLFSLGGNKEVVSMPDKVRPYQPSLFAAKTILPYAEDADLKELARPGRNVQHGTTLAKDLPAPGAPAAPQYMAHVTCRLSGSFGEGGALQFSSAPTNADYFATSLILCCDAHAVASFGTSGRSTLELKGLPFRVASAGSGSLNCRQKLRRR